MKEKHDYEVILFPTLDRVERLVCGVGHFIKNVVTAPHLLSPISDHEFLHPLDTPIAPVTSLYESEGSYYFSSDVAPKPEPPTAV